MKCCTYRSFSIRLLILVKWQTSPVETLSADTDTETRSGFVITVCVHRRLKRKATRRPSSCSNSLIDIWADKRVWKGLGFFFSSTLFNVHRDTEKASLIVNEWTEADLVRDTGSEKASHVGAVIQACGVNLTVLQASLINSERVTVLTGACASHFVNTVVL